MKNQLRCTIFLTCFLFFIFIFSGIFSCGEESATSSSNVTIQGTLNLPSEAVGKTWAVLIDNDYDGGNGYVKLALGTCGAGTNISYSIGDVPAGSYFIYAAVFVVGDVDQGPELGDFYGIYGGELPDNMPGNPNAKVSSDNRVFDINLYVMGIDISPAAIVAHWTFDEMSGNTLNDNSIYGNDGTIVNAQWVEGYDGGALQFEDDCYVNVSYSMSLQPTENITLEAIVKFNTFDQSQGILSTNQNGGYGFWVYETQPNIFIQIDSVYYSAVASSDGLNLNQWYHIAGVYDGSELKFYIDGDLKESIYVTGPIIYRYQNALKIGSDASEDDSPDEQFFQGSIDEIRITNIALEPEQFLSF